MTTSTCTSPGCATYTSYSMRGTLEEIAAEVRAFAAVGVTHLALAFGTTDAAEVVARAERFAGEVAPLV